MKKFLCVALVFVLAGLSLAGAKSDRAGIPVSKSGTTIEASSSLGMPSTLPPVGSRNPNTLDEVIISENFDAIPDGQLPAGWTQVDVDGGYCTQFAAESEWQVNNYGTNAHSGTNVAMCFYNDGGLANDDWLILPQQTLAGTITLTYWAASQDADWLDSYEIRVSTTGAEPANFTNLIYSATNHTTTWTEHVHDLSAYAGQAIYIAIHYNSVDRFVLKIDDLLLEAGAAAPHGVIQGSVTNAETTDPVPGVLVEIEGTTLDAVTDDAGEFEFPNVPAGTYALNFSHGLYEDYSETGVAVAVDETTHVDIAMTPLDVAQQDYPYTGPVEAIADMDTAFLSLDIADEYLIVDVDVTINITHTYTSDLTVWLQNPAGDRVELAFEVGGNGDNFVNTRFDDEATTPIGNGTAPFTGSFQPSEPLSAFDGEDLDGTWTLVVWDGYAQDIGSINSFTLHVTYDASGAVDGPGAGVPNAFAFHGNYPNPFNAQTTFSFTLDRAGQVELALYNVTGQEVARVVEGPMVAGSHTVSYDAAGLPSGIYFARLTAAGRTAAHKIALLK